MWYVQRREREPNSFPLRIWLAEKRHALLKFLGSPISGPPPLQALRVYCHQPDLGRRERHTDEQKNQNQNQNQAGVLSCLLEDDNLHPTGLLWGLTESSWKYFSLAALDFSAPAVFQLLGSLEPSRMLIRWKSCWKWATSVGNFCTSKALSSGFSGSRQESLTNMRAEWFWCRQWLPPSSFRGPLATWPSRWDCPPPGTVGGWVG